MLKNVADEALTILLLLCRYWVQIVGRDSSVGTATRYGLDGPVIESQWGAKFSAPIQNGPGAQPASYKTGTGSFPGVKRPEPVLECNLLGSNYDKQYGHIGSFFPSFIQPLYANGMTVPQIWSRPLPSTAFSIISAVILSLYL